MSQLIITDLWIYPIKSLSGIQLTSSKVEFRGLQYDRRWVLSDAEGHFVHQREYPEMALLQPAIEGSKMVVRHKSKDIEPLIFDISEPDTNEVEVTVWDDMMPAKPVSKEANDWFSNIIGKPVQLLYMHESSVRQADQRYAINANDKVSFADGYPILFISEESLELLNSKSEQLIPMDRFRANVIFKGGNPHEEDMLRHIKIGDLELYGVKPCARCVMTTIDQQTATKGKEPLKTLATYRKAGNKILFGENFIPMNEDNLKVGDSIQVLERKASQI